MYGKLLNPYAIERAVRSFVHGTGVRVLFDQDKGGHTDGKDIHVERLRFGMTEAEALEVYATVVHELGHHLYSNFDVLAEKREAGMRMHVWNILEDARMEYQTAADAVGWHNVLQESYVTILSDLLQKEEMLTPKSTPMRLFLAFDAACRSRMFNTGRVAHVLRNAIDTFDTEEAEIHSKLLDFMPRMYEVMDVVDKRSGTLATWELMDEMMRLFPAEDAESRAESEKVQEGEGEDGEESEGKAGGRSEEQKEADGTLIPSKMRHKEDGTCEMEPVEHENTGIVLHDGEYETTPLDKIRMVDYSKGEKVGGSYSYYDGSPDFNSGGLANKVRRLLQIRSRSRNVYGQKKGRLDQRNLYRVGMRNEMSSRVFKGKTEAHTLKETAVHLLVDCSGSMCGANIQHAIDSAGQMSGVLSNLGVPHAITGFTAMTETTLYLFKQLHESPRDLHARFVDGCTSLDNNHDGEAVMYAESTLAHRSEKHKVIIVFSDGAPCGFKSGCSQQLLDAVKCVESRRDMEIYGVGIGRHAPVEDYYKRYVKIERAEQLEDCLLTLIEEVV